MNKLQVLLMLIWSFVLVFPAQTQSLSYSSHLTVYQQDSHEKDTPVALLFGESNKPGFDALHQLDETPLLTIAHNQSARANYTLFIEEPASTLQNHVRADNGLHTILTAGP